MNYIFKIALKIVLSLFILTIAFYILWSLIIYFKTNKENEAYIKQIKKEQIQDSLECVCSKISVIKDIMLGNIIIYYKGKSPYFYEIALKEFGIYVQPIALSANRACGISIMDSVINLKYGKDIITRIEKKSDSLYKKRPEYYIDLDGNYLSAAKGISYKCGDIKKILNYIELDLKQKDLIPIKDSCSPKELIIDFVISKNGKLGNIRILKKLNSKIDSTVVSLLKNLPCDWVPAKSKGLAVNFRKKMHFYFGNP
jgi:hypothetical protein